MNHQPNPVTLDLYKAPPTTEQLRELAKRWRIENALSYSVIPVAAMFLWAWTHVVVNASSQGMRPDFIAWVAAVTGGGVFAVLRNMWRRKPERLRSVVQESASGQSYYHYGRSVAQDYASVLETIDAHPACAAYRKAVRDMGRDLTLAELDLMVTEVSHSQASSVASRL